MAKCAFFGHAHFNFDSVAEKLKNIIIDLIENNGVTEFYCGTHGNFDRLCTYTVTELKNKYPQIKLIKVLSYMPREGDISDNNYDGSIYLIERKLPQRFAISETNKLLADYVDYVVAGLYSHSGGAYNACSYALKRKKDVIILFAGYEF